MFTHHSNVHFHDYVIQLVYVHSIKVDSNPLPCLLKVGEMLGRKLWGPIAPVGMEIYDNDTSAVYLPKKMSAYQCIDCCVLTIFVKSSAFLMQFVDIDGDVAVHWKNFFVSRRQNKDKRMKVGAPSPHRKSICVLQAVGVGRLFQPVGNGISMVIG